MSKDDVARILEEVAKLEPAERKKVQKGIKRSLQGEPTPGDTPTSKSTAKR
jgi:hypothetical protein